MTQPNTFGFAELTAPTAAQVAEFDAETEALRASLIKQSHDEGYGFLPPEDKAAPQRREVPIQRAPAPAPAPAPTSTGLHPSFGHALTMMAQRRPSPARYFAQAAQDGLILIEVCGAANRDMDAPGPLSAEEAVFGAMRSIIAAAVRSGALDYPDLERIFREAENNVTGLESEAAHNPVTLDDMVELARAARMAMGFMPAAEAAELRAKLEAMGL